MKMTTIFVDDSGSPIVDQSGKLIFVRTSGEFKQRIMNVLNTQRGSESVKSDYGFNKMALVHGIPNADREMLIKSLLIEALNPQEVYFLKTVQNISVEEVASGIIRAMMMLTDYNDTFYSIPTNIEGAE